MDAVASGVGDSTREREREREKRSGAKGSTGWVRSDASEQSRKLSSEAAKQQCSDCLESR